MDCKIGVRTYLEEELLKAKEKQKLRKVTEFFFLVFKALKLVQALKIF